MFFCNKTIQNVSLFIYKNTITEGSMPDPVYTCILKVNIYAVEAAYCDHFGPDYKW